MKMKQLFLPLGLAAATAVMFTTGCASLEDAAMEGDSNAQWQLAEKMMTGKDGYPCNPGEAKKWLEKSIEAENLEAKALKGDFMLAGRYGKDIPLDEILNLVYPAVEQNKSSMAGDIYLRAVITRNDVSHMKECAAAIDAVFNGPQQYRRSTSLFLYKKMKPWIQKAMNISGMRLAEQKKQLEMTEEFISVAWALTHDQRKELEEYECDRVSAALAVFRKEIEGPREILSRSIEVEGVGADVKSCEKDAQTKALLALCGVKVTSSQSLNEKESVSNENTEEKSDFKNDVSSIAAGKLESFSVVSKPAKQADGTFRGIFHAVAKKEFAAK